MKRRGNCYVTCEALYHLLGGKKSGWKVLRMPWEGDMHWYLMRGLFESVNPVPIVLDPTVKQFKKKPTMFHRKNLSVGCGFLTKRPSKRAREMMKRMLWQ